MKFLCPNCHHYIELSDMIEFIVDERTIDKDVDLACVDLPENKDKVEWK